MEKTDDNQNLDFPIDIDFLKKLDEQTTKISSDLVALNETLKNDLDQISKTTVESYTVYKGGALDACDSIDSSIKSMYGLMAKCEELGKAMEPAGKLAQEAKEIRKLLDACEHKLNQTNYLTNTTSSGQSQNSTSTSLNLMASMSESTTSSGKPKGSSSSSGNPCPTFMIPASHQAQTSDTNNSD